MTNPMFDELLQRFSADYTPLVDKPEETPERTLRALWLLAAGEPRAAERCDEVLLPPLSDAESAQLHNLLDRRLAGVPLAHLTGRQCFMGIEMLAGPAALVPRKETEILGRAALDTLRNIVASRGAATVIDLCTGCGNLALALAHFEPHCAIYAADLSEDAVALARRSARYLRLEERVVFRAGDLFAPFDTAQFWNTVDLVVCNPPYISNKHIAEMPEEIQAHEPRMAFDGGPFGVSIIFRLIKEAPRFLKPGGWLGLEVGYGQGELVAKRVARNTNYQRVVSFDDASGVVRALFIQRA